MPPSSAAASLDDLHARIAPCFRRPEVRARARRYLDGPLAHIGRKNGWQLAEALGERTPDGVQRLLNAAHWDADLVRDDLRRYVGTHPGDAEAVLVIDETGFLKKGRSPQGWRGSTAARPGGSTTARSASFSITPHGQAFLDRAFIPAEGVDGRRGAASGGGYPRDSAFCH